MSRSFVRCFFLFLFFRRHYAPEEAGEDDTLVRGISEALGGVTVG